MDPCFCCKTSHRDIHLAGSLTDSSPEVLSEDFLAELGECSLSWFDDLTESYLARQRGAEKVSDRCEDVSDVWSPCPRGGLFSVPDDKCRQDVTPMTALLSSGSSSRIETDRSSPLKTIGSNESEIMWSSAMATPTVLDSCDKSSTDRVPPSENSSSNVKPKPIHRKLFSPKEGSAVDDSLTQILDACGDADVTVESEKTFCEGEDTSFIVGHSCDKKGAASGNNTDDVRSDVRNNTVDVGNETLDTRMENSSSYSDCSVIYAESSAVEAITRTTKCVESASAVDDDDIHFASSLSLTQVEEMESQSTWINEMCVPAATIDPAPETLHQTEHRQCATSDSPGTGQDDSVSMAGTGHIEAVLSVIFCSQESPMNDRERNVLTNIDYCTKQNEHAFPGSAVGFTEKDENAVTESVNLSTKRIDVTSTDIFSKEERTLMSANFDTSREQRVMRDTASEYVSKTVNPVDQNYILVPLKSSRAASKACTTAHKPEDAEHVSRVSECSLKRQRISENTIVKRRRLQNEDSPENVNSDEHQPSCGASSLGQVKSGVSSEGRTLQNGSVKDLNINPAYPRSILKSSSKLKTTVKKRVRFEIDASSSQATVGCLENVQSTKASNKHAVSDLQTDTAEGLVVSSHKLSHTALDMPVKNSKIRDTKVINSDLRKHHELLSDSGVVSVGSSSYTDSVSHVMSCHTDCLDYFENRSRSDTGAEQDVLIENRCLDSPGESDTLTSSQPENSFTNAANIGLSRESFGDVCQQVMGLEHQLGCLDDHVTELSSGGDAGQDSFDENLPASPTFSSQVLESSQTKEQGGLLTGGPPGIGGPVVHSQAGGSTHGLASDVCEKVGCCCSVGAVSEFCLDDGDDEAVCAAAVLAESSESVSEQMMSSASFEGQMLEEAACLEWKNGQDSHKKTSADVASVIRSETASQTASCQSQPLYVQSSVLQSAPCKVSPDLAASTTASTSESLLTDSSSTSAARTALSAFLPDAVAARTVAASSHRQQPPSISSHRQQPPSISSHRKFFYPSAQQIKKEIMHLNKDISISVTGKTSPTLPVEESSGKGCVVELDESLLMSEATGQRSLTVHMQGCQKEEATGHSVHTETGPPRKKANLMGFAKFSDIFQADTGSASLDSCVVKNKFSHYSSVLDVIKCEDGTAASPEPDSLDFSLGKESKVLETCQRPVENRDLVSSEGYNVPMNSSLLEDFSEQVSVPGVQLSHVRCDTDSQKMEPEVGQNVKSESVVCGSAVSDGSCKTDEDGYLSSQMWIQTEFSQILTGVTGVDSVVCATEEEVSSCSRGCVDNAVKALSPDGFRRDVSEDVEVVDVSPSCCHDSWHRNDKVVDVSTSHHDSAYKSDKMVDTSTSDHDSQHKNKHVPGSGQFPGFISFQTSFQQPQLFTETKSPLSDTLEDEFENIVKRKKPVDLQKKFLPPFLHRGNLEKQPGPSDQSSLTGHMMMTSVPSGSWQLKSFTAVRSSRLAEFDQFLEQIESTPQQAEDDPLSCEDSNNNTDVKCEENTSNRDACGSASDLFDVDRNSVSSRACTVHSELDVGLGFRKASGKLVNVSESSRLQALKLMDDVMKVAVENEDSEGLGNDCKPPLCERIRPQENQYLEPTFRKNLENLESSSTKLASVLTEPTERMQEMSEFLPRTDFSSLFGVSEKKDFSTEVSSDVVSEFGEASGTRLVALTRNTIISHDHKSKVDKRHPGFRPFRSPRMLHRDGTETQNLQPVHGSRIGALTEIRGFKKIAVKCRSDASMVQRKDETLNNGNLDVDDWEDDSSFRDLMLVDEWKSSSDSAEVTQIGQRPKSRDCESCVWDSVRTSHDKDSSCCTDYCVESETSTEIKLAVVDSGRHDTQGGSALENKVVQGKEQPHRRAQVSNQTPSVLDSLGAESREQTREEHLSEDLEHPGPVLGFQQIKEGGDNIQGQVVVGGVTEHHQRPEAESHARVKFPGFSTARGASVTVSERSLLHARKVLNDVDSETSMPGLCSSPSGNSSAAVSEGCRLENAGGWSDGCPHNVQETEKTLISANKFAIVNGPDSKILNFTGTNTDISDDSSPGPDGKSFDNILCGSDRKVFCNVLCDPDINFCGDISDNPNNKVSNNLTRDSEVKITDDPILNTKISGNPTYTSDENATDDRSCNSRILPPDLSSNISPLNAVQIMANDKSFEDVRFMHRESESAAGNKRTVPVARVGFSTASGRNVLIAASSLEHARSFFAEAERTGSQEKVASEKSFDLLIASGSNVPVGESPVQRARNVQINNEISKDGGNVVQDGQSPPAHTRGHHTPVWSSCEVFHCDRRSTRGKRLAGLLSRPPTPAHGDPALSVGGVTPGAFRPPIKMSKGGAATAAAAGHSGSNGSTQTCSARVSATAKTFISPASTHTSSSFSSPASLPQQLHQSMSDKKTPVFAYRKLEYTKSDSCCSEDPSSSGVSGQHQLSDTKTYLGHDSPAVRSGVQKNCRESDEVSVAFGSLSCTRAESEGIPVEVRPGQCLSDVTLLQDCGPLPVDLTLEESRRKQEAVIQSKKKQRVRPRCGHWLGSRKRDVNTFMSLGLVPVTGLTRDELLKLGVSSSTIEVNSASAKHFRFDLRRFYPALKSGVLVGDGALLVPDRHGFAGTEEFYRAFLTLDGVDPNLIDEAWVENHYRWIVWKLAAYEVSLPHNFAGRCLNPQTVMLQLKYRYDREVDSCHRSAIKKILERDDTSYKRMVLCVVSVKRDLENQVLVELTDGWYSIPAQLDTCLSDLVSTKRLGPGDKIVTSGAELVGCPGGCSPLELKDGIFLRLSGNSTRPAPWYAKLGYCSTPSPLCVPITSLSPCGGVAGCVDVVVCRKYPVMYMERLPNGSCVFHTVEEEDRARQKHEEQNQAKMEKLYASLQKEVEDSLRSTKPGRVKRCKKDISSLWTGQELASALDEAVNPEELQQTLSASQVERLMMYRQAEIDRRQQEISRKMQEALAEAGNSRNVVPVQKFKVSGCCSVDVDNKASCVISVWRPGEEWMEVEEGKRYRLFSVAVSPVRVRLTREKVALTATRQTRIQLCPISENLLDIVYEQREAWTVSELLSRVPSSGEFDFVGAAIQVVAPQRSSGPTCVFVSDKNRDILCVKFWSDFQGVSLRTGQCFVASSLMLSRNSQYLGAASSCLVTAEARPGLTTVSASGYSSRYSDMFSQVQALCKTPGFLSSLQTKLSIYSPSASSVGGQGLHPAQVTQLEDYNEDFPPDVVDKIFAPMSQEKLRDGSSWGGRQATLHELWTCDHGSQTAASGLCNPSHVTHCTEREDDRRASDSVISSYVDTEQKPNKKSCLAGKAELYSNQTSRTPSGENQPTSEKAHTNEGDVPSVEDSYSSEILKKRKSMLRAKMSKLMIYERPSPLPRLCCGSSPSTSREFKSPHSQKS